MSELKDRWSDDQIQQVNRALVKGGNPTSPFGEASGRVDLRGVVIKEFIKGQSLARLDFSECAREWAGQFALSSLEDCVFDGGVVDTNLGNRLIRCSFRKSKMKGAVLRGTFSGCEFAGANLISALADGAVFKECSFDGANLRKAQLTACMFEGCSFERTRFGSGSVASSRFIGCSVGPDVLGNTLIEDVQFE